MNKILFFLFFLVAEVLAFSSVPLPPSLEFYSGYREDQFSFKLLSDHPDETLIYREKLDHPKCILCGVCLTTINNGFYFLTDLSYAPLISRRMHITDRDYDLIEMAFNHKVKGYDIGALGELGIAANLTPDRIYKFYVIPLAGYSGFWKDYKRLGQTIGEVVDPQTGDLFIENSFLAGKKLKQIWYGPYVGGKIYIVPNDTVNFDLTYHFNWMKLKLKFLSKLEVEKTDMNGNLLLSELVTKEMDDTASECYGHFAEGKVTFNTSRHLKIAFLARFNYYMADKKKVVLSTFNEEAFPEKNYSEQNTLNRIYSGWWNVAGAFELICQF